MASPPTEAELTMSDTTIDSLPDDILTEFLLRVPTPADLVRAAATWRKWRNAIAAEGFLGSYRELHKSSPFLGLYVPRELAGPPSFQMPDSIRVARDDAGGRKDAARRASDFGEIRRYQDHRLHDDAFVLGPLPVHPDCRLLDCHNSRFLLTRGDEALEVRSPLARESILLPFPSDVVRPYCLEACLLQGRDKAAASFRVVYLQHRREGRNRRQVRAFEYDSGRMTWQGHPWETLSSIIVGAPEEVMHAGHRVFCRYNVRSQAALVLDTMKMEFSVLPLPTDANFAIGEIEDNICCLVEAAGCTDHRLRVWQLSEKKLDWELKKDIKMDQVLGEHVGYYRPRVISNGIALVCSTTTQHHFAVDLSTYTVKEKFEFHGQSAYLMQMPWPPAISGTTANAAGGFDDRDDGGPASVGDARTGSGELDNASLFGGTLAMAPPAPPSAEPEEPLVWRSRSPDLLLQPPALGRKWAGSRESKGSLEAMGLGPGRRIWKRKPKYLEAIFALRRRHSFSIASKATMGQGRRQKMPNPKYHGGEWLF